MNSKAYSWDECIEELCECVHRGSFDNTNFIPINGHTVKIIGHESHNIYIHISLVKKACFPLSSIFRYYFVKEDNNFELSGAEMIPLITDLFV